MSRKHLINVVKFLNNELKLTFCNRHFFAPMAGYSFRTSIPRAVASRRGTLNMNTGPRPIMYTLN